MSHGQSESDEYDAAQERGKVAAQGKPSKEKGLATASQIGLSYKQIHEARAVRDGPPRITATEITSLPLVAGGNMPFTGSAAACYQVSAPTGPHSLYTPVPPLQCSPRSRRTVAATPE